MSNQVKPAPAVGNVAASLRGQTESAEGSNAFAPRRRLDTRPHLNKALRRLSLAAVLLVLAPAAWAADLQITSLSDDNYDPTPAGGEVIYSVTIENGAADTVNAVTIFDLPAGTTASTLPAYCAADAGTPTRIVCNNGPLVGTLSPGGAASTFQIGLNTAGQQPGAITIRGAVGFAGAVPPASTPIASLPLTDAFFQGDTNTNNNIRAQVTTLTNAGDLRLTKTATPDPVVGGAEITYTLTVTNDGPGASSNFNVVDTLPAAASYVASSFVGTGWTFNAGTMTATHAGALASGSSRSFTFRAKVNAGSGNIINSAMVNAAAGTPDPNPGNNSAQVTTPVTPGADLTLSKSAAPAPAISGQPVTFTLVARNLGPSAAQNVSFTDNMPAGFVITGGTQPAGWTCTNNGTATARTCTRGTLANGAVDNFTIVATVPASGTNSSGNVTNTASITSDTPDPNGPTLGNNNNTASTTFTVLSDGADLRLTKAKTPALVAVWDGVSADTDSRMTSTITVRNLGPRAASGQVQVVDELAAGEEYLSAGGPWTCTVDTPYGVPPA
ncbi:MAG: DUF11 domain-containing protein, partial [Pseudoxanthomonas sp.]